jgi:outer membrane protein assembly factor BamB
MNTGSPAVANGKVYIGTIDHYFYAFDQKTGRQLWGIDTQDDLEAISPTVVGNVVFIGGGCPEADCFNGLRALSSETGAEIWKRRLDNGLSTGPTAAGGVVYAGSGTGKVYALDAATGRTIWQTQAGTRPLTLAAALSGDRLYVGSGGGRLYALAINDGAIAWSAPLPDDNYGAPAIQAGTVYIGGGNSLFAFDAESGNALWSADLGGQVIWSSPTVANGVVYCGSNGGGVVAFAAADGRRLWSALAGQTVHSAPTIVDGAVYLGSENGRVYAFDLTVK